MIVRIDITRHICRKLVGHECCTKQRMIVGGVLMVVGVSLSLVIGESFHGAAGHIVGEILGFGIHGIGYAPYLEWLLEEEGGV